MTPEDLIQLETAEIALEAFKILVRTSGGGDKHWTARKSFDLAEAFVDEAMKRRDSDEYSQLLSEKTELERLIEQLPEDSVIERTSLISRKAEVESLLESGKFEKRRGE